MRIAILTVLYQDMIRGFYRANPDSTNLAAEEHRLRFDRSVSLWAGGWARAFTARGWEATTITINNDVLQQHWARERDLPHRSLEAIALEQIRQFKPDVLWFDYFDSVLLRRIREEIPSLRLVLGWTGSALVDERVLRESDLVLSCAPEAVERLRTHGLKAEHLHHAFEEDLLPSIGQRTFHDELSFVGQIFRGGDLHGTREQLLLQLVKELRLTIFSPSFSLGFKDILRYSAKKLAYYGLKPLLAFHAVEEWTERNKYLKEIRRAKESTWIPYNRTLQRSMSPPVYGIDMLQKLRQSKVVLNIHADSSPRYASNMRLFETTGSGACLLTDWKQNLDSLFSEETEVVSYRSAEECVEKARWLLSHETEREAIAAAGHRRILKDHTFHKRVEQLLVYINRAL